MFSAGEERIREKQVDWSALFYMLRPDMFAAH